MDIYCAQVKIKNKWIDLTMSSFNRQEVESWLQSFSEAQPELEVRIILKTTFKKTRKTGCC